MNTANALSFIRREWFRLSVVVLGLVVIFLVSDYFERQQINADLDKLTKVEQDNEKRAFENNLKCQDLLLDLKKRWNNVAGIYYSSYQNTCIVKYTIDGEVEEAPIERMQDSE